MTTLNFSHGWANTIAAIRGPHVKVICPTAATMPVTLNAGFRMPSWFDLRTLDATAPEDEEGIVRATDHVHRLIANEIKVSKKFLINQYYTFCSIVYIVSIVII